MQYWPEEMKWDKLKRDFGGDFLHHREMEEPMEAWAATRNRTTNYAHELADHVHMSTIKDPNNVSIDNTSHHEQTRIDIIAGNRAGSLLEMTQCIAEMGLGIRKAVVSSAQGKDENDRRADWFYDSFWVFDPQEPTRRVLSEVKQKNLLKVMSLNPADDAADLYDTKNMPGHTIIELSGPDRPGLLKSVAEELQMHSLDIRSLAVWTQEYFAAFVLTVNDRNTSINANAENATARVEGIKERLRAIMDGNKGNISATAGVFPVKGPIHHDRRLHRLLFKMEERKLKQQWENLASTQKKQELTEWQPEGSYDYNTLKPDELVNGEPWIGICQWDWEEIWEIHIKCQDRMKLAFDIATALADLGLDVTGARIDLPTPGPPTQGPPPAKGEKKEKMVVEHFYEVVPPPGGSHWLKPDDWRANRIHKMLMKALTRRHPLGAKVSLNNVEDITPMAQKLYEAGLTIKRARVNPYDSRNENGAGTHTLYLMGRDGHHPTAQELEKVSARFLGGTMTIERHMPGSVDSASLNSSSHNSALKDYESQWSGVAASPSPSSVPRSNLLRHS